MRGLTLYEPHATLVALADRKRYPMQGDLCKRIETRSQRISYRGPLAIHAAQTFPAAARNLIMNIERSIFTKALHRAGYSYAALMFAMSAKHEVLPLGKIVAVARLVECLEITPQYSAFVRRQFPHEYTFGDYTPGRWAWLLDDIRALPEPIPCRGMQGLWPVPPDAMARLAEMGVAG